jgi:Chaperone of endosialidase/FlgD Ig-like domain
MTCIKHLAFALAVTLFLLAVSAQAQTPRMTTVNISAQPDKVHISAEGNVSELRVDVTDESGEVVFQSGAITGQQLDWNMKDASGERVPAGTYLVTVTYRNAAGKLKKRIEQVSVAEAEQSGTQDTAAPQAVQETVTTSNPGVFGSIARFTGAATIANSVISQSTEGKIGIGTTAPAEKLHISGPESRLRLQSTNSNLWTVTEYVTDNRVWHTGVGGSNVPNDVKDKYYVYDATTGQFRMVISTDGRVGIGTTKPEATLDVTGGSIRAFTLTVGRIRVGGFATFDYLGSPSGSTVQVCRDSLKLLSTCSSSLRYKTDMRPFVDGLSLINRLKPVTFRWKGDGVEDVGLGAEDVAEVEPLLTFNNEQGEVEGVKYDRLSIVFINAFKEQQSQLQQQQKLIEQLQAQLNQVKRAIKRKRTARR